MSRPLACLLACALGAGTAIALVSCGGGESDELLPGNTAREISENLSSVEQLAEAGDCVGAEAKALEISEQIDELGGVDKRLKEALRTGTNRLDSVIASGCAPETEESIAQESIPEEDEGAETETTEHKPPKKPPAAEAKTAPTTPTPPAETAPPPTVSPISPASPPAEENEGNSPSGGVGPGSAGEGGD